MTRLTPAQKTVALHRMNEDTCTCGCQYTLAQCRIYYNANRNRIERAAKIVAECPPTALPRLTKIHLTKTRYRNKLPHLLPIPNPWPSPRKLFSYLRSFYV